MTALAPCVPLWCYCAACFCVFGLLLQTGSLKSPGKFTASGDPLANTVFPALQIIIKPAKRFDRLPLSAEATAPFWEALRKNLHSSSPDSLSKKGLSITPLRPMSGGAWVASLAGLPLSRTKDVESIGKSARQLFRGWQHQGLVDYAVVDEIVSVSTVPDDPLYGLQWHLGDAEVDYAALNLPKAWDITRGSTDVVVAVIDTGVRFENSELNGRLLAGYDFVSGINDFRTRQRVPDSLNFIKAHDGDGRDADASDPGDGVDAALHNMMQAEDVECPQQESTWHGTAMASLIAANGSDGHGMTGVDWSAMILPVRAIGKCGGRRSDLLDAIRWAAGVSDPQLPENPTPARVINLSLGIDDACTAADQQAIDDAAAMGSLIVAAVGNLGRNLDEEPSSPSHCNNVLGVTAVDSAGYRASYSSYGEDADLAAPGGEGLGGDNRPILIATNDGFLEPATSESHRYTTGTSVASPLVAGVISLMLSANPGLSNAEIRALLQESSRGFPGIPEQSNDLPCTTETCGSGLVDAYGAVLAAQSFDPENPGRLATAIRNNEAVFKSSGGASINLWILLLLALGVVGKRHRTHR